MCEEYVLLFFSFHSSITLLLVVWKVEGLCLEVS